MLAGSPIATAVNQLQEPQLVGSHGGRMLKKLNEQIHQTRSELGKCQSELCATKRKSQKLSNLKKKRGMS